MVVRRLVPGGGPLLGALEPAKEGHPHWVAFRTSGMRTVGRRILETSRAIFAGVSRTRNGDIVETHFESAVFEYATKPIFPPWSASWSRSTSVAPFTIQRR